MAINKLTVEQAAYIAGFLDGEGSLQVRIRKDLQRSYKITIGQKAPIVLFWIEAVIGIGRVCNRRTRNTDGTWKQLHPHYVLGGRLQVLAFLEQLEPYLIVKKEEAKLVRAGKHPRPENISEAQRARWNMVL